MLGAILFGTLSESIWRSRSMILALLLCLAMIPAWTFGNSLMTLAVGAFVMLAAVRGSWGIITGTLNAIRPDSVSGRVPGLAHQLGILIAAPVNNVVYALRKPLGYSWALAAFEIANIAMWITFIAFGSEPKAKSLSHDEVAEPKM